MIAGALPYGRQWLDAEDIAAVTAVLQGDWLTTGPTVGAFEEAVAARVGARFAVACSSGTAGLHLAALALGLGPGDAAIVPSLTFLATANAARYVGAEVAFADVDPASGLMRAAQARAALADRPTARAVFTVHYAGQCADLPELAALAAAHGAAVVEDAAQAIGTTYLDAAGQRHHVGACAHSAMAVFSWHPVKTVTMGEGGVVTTNDEHLCRRLQRLRAHGVERTPAAFENRELAFDAGGAANPWYYEMPELGYNYRATDIHCALGLSQLRKLDGFVARREKLAERYDRALVPLSPLVRPLGRVAGVVPAWHLYVVLIDFAAAGVARGTVMRRLSQAGIGSQVHYLPLHLQPYYRQRYGAQRLPGAEAFYECALTLPLFAAMSESDVERVVAELGDALAPAGRVAGPVAATTFGPRAGMS